MVPVVSSQVEIRAALRRRITKACRRDLSKAFIAWLLQEPEERTTLARITAEAAQREGADMDFQTVSVLGFAADAGLLSESQAAALKNGLARLADRSPVVNGVPMPFCADAVGILGVSLGTKATGDRGINHTISLWAKGFLKASYDVERTQDWQRSLFAFADLQLGSPLGLAMPKSAEAADVRTAMRWRGLIDRGNERHAQEDAVQTLTLAAQDLPASVDCEYGALRVAALDWIIRTQSGTDRGVPFEGMDGSVEWTTPERSHGNETRDVPVRAVASENPVEAAGKIEERKPTVVLGSAGRSQGRPAGSVFAADPEIRKLVEKDPKILPHVNLAAHFQQAHAEAEVAFRQRELKERWAEWSGVYPWETERDPDITDCPWWVAGAEYVFHLTAMWRKHSPGEPEKIEAVLPKQIKLAADWVYWNKVYVHDIVFGKNSSAEHILNGHPGRFHNVAFLLAMRKFAEADLEEWRTRAAAAAGATTALSSRAESASLPLSQPFVGDSRSPASRKATKAARRNTKYEGIDQALIEISKAQPKNHLEVFGFLANRDVPIPSRKPFKPAGGWLKGFKQDPHRASAWLSQAWGRLGLPAFARGPKK